MKEGSWYLAGLSGRGKVEAKVLMGSGMWGGMVCVCVYKRAQNWEYTLALDKMGGRTQAGWVSQATSRCSLFGFMACLLVFLLYSQHKGKPLRV